MKPVIAVDVSPWVHRAHYTGAADAADAAARMLAKLYTQSRSDTWVMCLDNGRCAHRTELEPSYKAQRKPKPPELYKALNEVGYALASFGFHVIEAENTEADDLLASVASTCVQLGRDCWILTSDKDLMQLVDDYGTSVVNVWDPQKRKVYDPAAVREKFGVNPGQLRDYLALVGDTADNVKGVPGIGPKRAAAILNKYGSVANAVNSGDPKVVNKLRPHWQTYSKAWALVGLMDSIDVGYPSDWTTEPPF